MQLDVARQTALEPLRRGVEAQGFFQRVGDHVGVGQCRAAGVAEIGEIEREHAHEAAQRFDAGHDQRGRGQQHLALVEPVAVNLGMGEMRDQVVHGVLAPDLDDLRRVIAHPFKRRDMLAPLGAGDRIVLHHQHSFFAHRLLVLERQAERHEQYAHGEFRGEVGDIVELAPALEVLGRRARDFADRPAQPLQIAAHEGFLDQAAQAVVARRIGGAERRAGAAGQFRHHVALGRGIGPPILPGAHDVVVARQYPHAGLFAPEGGMLVAQGFVEREGVGVDFGGIGIEAEHTGALGLGFSVANRRQLGQRLNPPP